METMIKMLRNKNNVSQKELAAFLNVSQVQISKYESGLNEPDIGTILKLAKYFNVSIDELLCHSHTNESITKEEFVKLYDKCSDDDKKLLYLVMKKFLNE